MTGGLRNISDQWKEATNNREKKVRNDVLRSLANNVV
jgi:hypothetical protein